MESASEPEEERNQNRNRAKRHFHDFRPPESSCEITRSQVWKAVRTRSGRAGLQALPQIEVVPSDQVTAHSPTGMHGLKLAFGDAGLLTAPRCRLWTTAIHCFGDPHLPSPIEAGFSARSFTRPQRLSVT